MPPKRKLQKKDKSLGISSPVIRKKRPYQKRLKWSAEAMANAMNAVEDGSSIASAARLHNVPRTTLQNRMLRNVEHGAKPGAKPYFNTGEEKELAEFIIESASVGHGKNRAEIMSVAEKAARDKGVLRKSKITHGWFDKFMQRQSYLSLRKGDATAIVRMEAISIGAINQYFDLLNDVLEKNNLKQSPGQIYNVDESGMALEHRPPKVVTLKGQKKVKCRTSGDKSQITVVGCVSAVGQAIPPFVIFKAKTLSPLWMKNGVSGTAYARSEKGWIDTELFHSWLSTHFLKYAVSSRPLLLILDGHSSHYQLETVKFAKSNEIILFCLPPHTTHVSQPLDTCVFGPLKNIGMMVYMTFFQKTPKKPSQNITFHQYFEQLGRRP